MAGARAPVAVGRLCAVGLGAGPAGCGIGVGERAAAILARLAGCACRAALVAARGKPAGRRADIVEARGAVRVLATGAKALRARAATIADAVAAIGRAGIVHLDMGLGQFVE